MVAEPDGGCAVRRGPLLGITAIAFLLVTWTVVRAAGESGAGDIVLDRIWYRTERLPSLPKSFKGNGDLRIGDDGLEFVHGKKGWLLRWDEIRFIWFGPMRGDVDTDWVVLSTKGADLGERVGLRDGRRMGYGERTEALFEQIKDAAREVRAGQFDVPEGFEPFEGLEHLLSVAVPREWSLEHRSAVVQDGRVHEGVLYFHEPFDSPDTRSDPESEALDSKRRRDGIGRGEIRAIRLERRHADRGMKRDGFSEEAVDRFVGEMLRDRNQLGTLATSSPPRTRIVTVDGLTGVRVRGEGTDPAGTARYVESVAISDGAMLYVFRMVGPVDRRESDSRLLDTVLDTVRFAPGR